MNYYGRLTPRSFILRALSVIALVVVIRGLAAVGCPGQLTTMDIISAVVVMQKEAGQMLCLQATKIAGR